MKGRTFMSFGIVFLLCAYVDSVIVCSLPGSGHAVLRVTAL